MVWAQPIACKRAISPKPLGFERSLLADCQAGILFKPNHVSLFAGRSARNFMHLALAFHPANLFSSFQKANTAFMVYRQRNATMV